MIRSKANHWTYPTISEVAMPDVDRGGPQTETFQYVDIGSVDNHRKIISEPRSLELRNAPSRARQIVRRGDVLVSMTRPNLNAVAQVPLSLDGAVASTGFQVLRPSPHVLSDWLFYYVQSQQFVSAMTEKVLGVLYPAVRPHDILAHHIPLPPMPEQRHIVSEIEKQFTRLDGASQNLRLARRRLATYRTSILHSAVTGTLAPNEHALASENRAIYESGAKLLERIRSVRSAIRRRSPKGDVPPEWESRKLPAGWTWATADEVCDRITDGEHITPQRSEDGVLLLSARNVLHGELSLKDVDYVPEAEYARIAKRLVVEPGDVLLSCSGSVGRSCVCPRDLRFALVRSVAVLKPVLPIGPFISLALRSPLLQQQIHAKKTQTAQANIFQSKIKQLVLPLPPLAEQQRIVDEAERRLAFAARLDADLIRGTKRAAQLATSILRDAFQGTLTPSLPA